MQEEFTKKAGGTMRKRILVSSMVLACSLLGLSGCSEKTTKEKELEKKVTELQKQVEQQQKEKEEEQKVAEQKPIEVNVVDPETKKSFKNIFTRSDGI